MMLSEGAAPPPGCAVGRPGPPQGRGRAARGPLVASRAPRRRSAIAPGSLRDAVAAGRRSAAAGRRSGATCLPARGRRPRRAAARPVAPWSHLLGDCTAAGWERAGDPPGRYCWAPVVPRLSSPKRLVNAEAIVGANRSRRSRGSARNGPSRLGNAGWRAGSTARRAAGAPIRLFRTDIDARRAGPYFRPLTDRSNPARNLGRRHRPHRTPPPVVVGRCAGGAEGVCDGDEGCRGGASPSGYGLRSDGARDPSTGDQAGGLLPLAVVDSARGPRGGRDRAPGAGGGAGRVRAGLHAEPGGYSSSSAVK